MDRVARAAGVIVLTAVLLGVTVLMIAGLSSVLIYALTFLR